ncbi:predicted protein [Naegleria gruberi]|uniref:Predicted protein n=1 Tax=Naegleria gruberi TaxID=5762 RepID=D2V003_NAEGR|nr:uncharacterized protein NAEGRDRAFT_62124 [Naegleria gruberi]EFC50023.1 predicted protein [Naegleria gruberi]|eukprot:XP_002682767.1 predicted protein [Naegleria gruberi strain NEG-M]
MSGILFKMGEVNKSWKERFFILEEDKLFYYKNSESSKAIAYIPLNDAYVRVSPEFYPKQACFEIVTSQRIYKLMAANFELMKTWIHHCQTFSKISMENELIRQADIQIHDVESGLTKKALEELHFEPISLENFYFSCRYNREEDYSNSLEFDLIRGLNNTSITNRMNNASSVVLSNQLSDDEDSLQMVDKKNIDLSKKHSPSIASQTPATEENQELIDRIGTE